MTTKFILPISLIILVAILLWAILAILFFPASEAQLGKPVSLHGPYDPLIYAFAADPLDPQALYAGTWGDGVFRSDDRGKTWQGWADGLENQAKQIRVIVRASTGKRPVYAGTWLGVYRRDEGDSSWHALSAGLAWLPGKPSPLEVTDLLLGDMNGDMIYAGTHSGVRKSADGGLKWEVKNEGLKDAALNIQALAADPDGNLYAATFGDGVYRSVDQGNHWISTTFSVQAVPTVTSLVIDPNNRIIYAGTFGNGVYASRDDGQTWEPRSGGIPRNSSALKIQTLAMDAEGRLYAGTVDYGVYESTDSAVTWQAVNNGLEGYALAILKIAVGSNGTDLYAGTYGGGVYRSDNQGKNWERQDVGIANGALPVQALAAGGPNSQWLYAGTDVGGVYQSQDGGLTWRRKNNGLPIGMARSIQVMDIGGENNRVIYVGTRAGLYRSVDGGESWKLNIVDKARPAAFVTGFARHPKVLYAAITDQPAGIYASADQGESWQLTTQELDLTRGVNRISLKAGEDGTLYATIFDYGVYKMRGGSKWELVKGSPKLVQALDVASKNTLQWLIYAGARQSLYAQALEGLYARRDQGDWLLRFPGAASTILADTAHARVVYAGTLTNTPPSGVAATTPSAIFGVMTSQDDGQSWKFDQETPSPVTALALNSQNATTLYIGTLNRGVFRSDVSLPSVWQRPDTVARLGILGILLVLAFDWLALSYEFRVLPHRVAWALTRPAALVQLLVEPSPLSPLQQLILAYWPERAARPEAVQKALERQQATTSWTQLTSALDDLIQSQHLAKVSGGAYRIRRSAFANIARRRFTAQQDILSKDVREESQVYLETQEFFQQAGLVPRTTRGGLFLLSPRGGIDAGVYAGVFGASPITARDVNTLFERARDEYHGQVEGRLAYAVIAAPPRAEAYRRMTELATEPPHFRIIPISHITIRQARIWGSAAAELARSEARVAPGADLYALDGPAIDPLDFFGRRDLIQQVGDTIEQECVIGLSGMPRIGKTSLLWQLRERLGNRPCAYMDLALLSGQPGDLVRALRAALSAEARVWEFSWQSVESPDRDSAETIAQMVKDYRDKMPHRLSERPLVLLVDTVASDTRIPWNILVELSRGECRLQVALGFADRGTDLGGQVHLVNVVPFVRQDAAELAQTLLRPMGSIFQMEALDRVYLETAGHPQLMRQLCSEIVSGSQGQARSITEQDVAEATQRYVLGRPSLLYQLWEFMTPIEQGILLHLAGPEATLDRAKLNPQAQVALDDLAQLGVVTLHGGRHRIAPLVLQAWLAQTFSPG